MTLPTVTSVALVGLGLMGAGIARNLDRAGLLVGACDLHPGAVAASGLSPNVHEAPVADLRRNADVMVFAVPTTASIRETLAASAGRAGQVVIDLTTSDPAESVALAHEMESHGQHYIDAAMTGGAAGADAGTLTLMCGGTPGVLAACRPVLDTFAAKVFHLGPVGSGHAMKLVHNMILHGIFLATCEGVRMAERAGLDPAQAVAVLNAGNARSFVSEVRFPRDILSGTMQARSKIGTLEKDLGLAVDFAARLDAPAPYGTLTRTLLAHAVAQGRGPEDFAWLFPAFEELARQT